MLRAPEVILGGPWGPPADIWNLGAVLLEVLDAVQMFDGRASETGGIYQTKHHLEDMEALFRPFPSQLLVQDDQTIVAEYFDEHGKVRDPVTRPTSILENWIEGLHDDDKKEFVMLIRSMMKINPNDRKPAREYVDKAWLRH